jgi:hypothetical protein
MAKEGVQGVGIGEKAGSLAILVLVDDAGHAAQVPSTLNNMPVSVRVVGTIHAASCGGSNPQNTYPLPVPLGVSGGNTIIVGGCCASGTIGFRVRDNVTGYVGWISNNHVVGHGADGCPNTAPIGTRQYQPGPIDTSPVCSPAQYIGSLNRVVPIVFGGANNAVDAGFVLSSSAAISGDILNLGHQVDNVVPAFVEQVVRKNGRTSGCTEGTVTGIHVTINVNYSETNTCPTSCGTATFTNQIMYSPTAPSTTMCEHGDSGSPVVAANNNAVALNFALNGIGDGWGNPIGAVLAGLDVTLSSSSSTQCITRTSRFWFTHGSGTDPSCVDLLDAIRNNGGMLNLGFITLPTTYYAGSSLTATDALIEALGLYWRSASRTGDDNGTQNARKSASLLCRARKLLAVELIAATANVSLFGTEPSNCTYVNGGTITNFPVDLLAQAQSAAAGEDVAACTNMTGLLQLFNLSGATNDFPTGLYECAAGRKSGLKKSSRDPTTKLNCPGLNDQCETAEAITSLPFTRSVDLRRYSDTFPAPFCVTNSGAGGGRNAVWKLSPPFAAMGRQFAAETGGSNFATMLSVWRGTCSNLVNISCSVNCGVSQQACLPPFTTDGTNTYYIVAEGVSGQYGRLKFKLHE